MGSGYEDSLLLHFIGPPAHGRMRQDHPVPNDVLVDGEAKAFAEGGYLGVFVSAAPVGEEYVAHVFGADAAEHFAGAGDALAATV